MSNPINNIIDSAVIDECSKMFPDAASEVEAVDLAAQDIFKELKNLYQEKTKDFELLKAKYGYLNNLRKHLHQRRLTKLSGFIITN